MVGAEKFSGCVTMYYLIFFKEEFDRIILLEPSTQSEKYIQECVQRSGCSFPGKVGLLGKSSFSA